MKLPYGDPLVIVNRAAGRHARAAADELFQALTARDVTFSYEQTDSAQALTTVAADAATRGHGFVIVVGGDGTVRDVVNGFFTARPDADANALPVLGILGAGTGSDLVRTYGLDRPVSSLIDHFLTDATTHIDVGHIEAHTRSRDTVTSHFLNVAQVGFGAHVARGASRLPKRLGARRYRAAVPLALTKFRHQPMRVTLDHTTVTDELLNVVIANGQFYGAGLHVAPQAVPHDGEFDVQCWQVKPGELAVAHEQLKHGDHLRRDGVRQWRSTTVAVHSPSAAPVEADGDPIGTTPARVTLKPHALRLKI